MAQRPGLAWRHAQQTSPPSPSCRLTLPLRGPRKDGVEVPQDRLVRRCYDFSLTLRPRHCRLVVGVWAVFGHEGGFS